MRRTFANISRIRETVLPARESETLLTLIRGSIASATVTKSAIQSINEENKRDGDPVRVFFMLSRKVWN